MGPTEREEREGDGGPTGLDESQGVRSPRRQWTSGNVSDKDRGGEGEGRVGLESGSPQVTLRKKEVFEGVEPDPWGGY